MRYRNFFPIILFQTGLYKKHAKKTRRKIKKIIRFPVFLSLVSRKQFQNALALTPIGHKQIHLQWPRTKLLSLNHFVFFFIPNFHQKLYFIIIGVQL